MDPSTAPPKHVHQNVHYSFRIATVLRNKSIMGLVLTKAKVKSKSSYHPPSQVYTEEINELLDFFVSSAWK